VFIIAVLKICGRCELYLEMACRVTVTARRAECKQIARVSVRVGAQGTQPDIKEKIYLGNGRFIEDDPALYPNKDEWGTGGWAGGEQGEFFRTAALFLRDGCFDNAWSRCLPGHSVGHSQHAVHTGSGAWRIKLPHVSNQVTFCLSPCEANGSIVPASCNRIRSFKISNSLLTTSMRAPVRL
jgi:hypothetical protein